MRVAFLQKLQGSGGCRVGRKRMDRKEKGKEEKQMR